MEFCYLHLIVIEDKKILGDMPDLGLKVYRKNKVSSIKGKKQIGKIMDSKECGKKGVPREGETWGTVGGK